MPFELKPYNKHISDEDLLNDLRAVARKLGVKTVKYEEYPQHGRCASRVFETRFGSWNSALTAAGLEIGRHQNIPDIELFENLENVWRSLGRQPSRTDLRKPLSRFSGGTYERRFNGWRAALEAFVAYASSDSDVAPDGIPGTSSSTKSQRFPDLRLRFRVLRRDSFKCQACGRSPALEHGVVLHIDHVLPWVLGGKTVIENLRTLCERCNLGKGDMAPNDA